jgi:hypothetical protein
MRILIFTLYFALITISGALVSAGAHAQRMADVLYGKDQSATVDPEYEKMIIDALSMPDDFLWMRLRRLYTQTSFFTPFAEELQLQLVELSDRLSETQVPEEQKKIIDRFQLITLKHLGNADIMSIAFSLATKDPRLGNAEFYQWALWGIMATVERTGDGDEISEAYNVITVGEETMLFRMLGVNHLGLEETIDNGFYVFNVHRVEDPATKRQFKVFVNITHPMSFLQSQEKKRKAQSILDIPKK